MEGKFLALFWITVVFTLVSIGFSVPVGSQLSSSDSSSSDGGSGGVRNLNQLSDVNLETADADETLVYGDSGTFVPETVMPVEQGYVLPPQADEDERKAVLAPEAWNGAVGIQTGDTTSSGQPFSLSASRQGNLVNMYLNLDYSGTLTAGTPFLTIPESTGMRPPIALDVGGNTHNMSFFVPIRIGSDGSITCSSNFAGNSFRMVVSYYV